MKTKLKIIGIILLTILAFSCSSNKTEKVEISSKDALSKIAVSKFGKEFKLNSNQDSSYVICYSQAKATKELPSPTLSYFIYNRKEAKITFEETGISGTIEWNDKTHVKVTLTKGAIKENYSPDDYIYYIDVISGRKTKKQIQLN